ncbi:MAG: protein phosphatase 2C domain-containing protein [Eubacteriales bacterium]|nr:protein phosphatase 2C domain-containing protein [Eubacteriales bacterium]
MKNIIEFVKQNLAVSVAAGVIVIAAIVIAVVLVRKTHRKNSGDGKRRLAVNIGASIHIGTRPYQQDAYFVPNDVSAHHIMQKGYLCVLCDGMGGLSGGEKASRLCVDNFARDYYGKSNGRPVLDFFKDEICLLDEKVCELKDDFGKRMRAGTTLVCAVIKDSKLYWASAGDSRIYIIRGDEIALLTRDHNYSLELAQEMKDGLISKEEAMAHPERDSLISFVGMDGMRIIDVNEEAINLQNGDAVLLCSDGLYRTMSTEEIVSVISGNRNNAELAAHILVAAAFDKNIQYQDNMSAVLMAYN